MKKTLAFILSFVMLLLLCACSPAEPKAETTPEPTTSQEPPVEVTSAPQRPTFAVTRDEYIADIDPYVEKAGYTKLADIEPTVSQESSETLGDYTSYQYDFPAGGSIGFYENPNGGLTDIFFIASTDIAENLEQFGLLIGLTESYFDGSDASTIDDTLNLSNISEDSITFATGKYVSYMYAVSGSLLHLSINPN